MLLVGDMKPGKQSQKIASQNEQEERADNREKGLVAGANEILHKVQNRLKGQFQALLYDSRVVDAQPTLIQTANTVSPRLTRMIMTRWGGRTS